MTRRFIDSKKGTNVRFVIIAATALLATGCGTVAPLSGQLQPNHPPGPTLCESFGPETRCSQPDTSRLARSLDRFNQSAQLGFRGW